VRWAKFSGTLKPPMCELSAAEKAAPEIVCSILPDGAPVYDIGAARWLAAES